MKQKIMIGFVLSMMLFGCHPSGRKINGEWNTHRLISKQNILANLEFLASDALEGREAGSRGEKLAALYLSTELKKYGVLPLSQDQGYLQPVDLQNIRFSGQSKLDLVDAQGELLHSLVYGVDFIGSPRYYPTLDTTIGVVFAGYGITAPEFNYDDYAKFDAEGKVVLVYQGEPNSEDSSYFGGAEDTRYSSIRHKMSNAREHGAAGIIFQFGPEKTFSWDKLKDYVKKGAMQLKGGAEEGEKKSYSEQIPAVTITGNSLRYFLESEKYSYDSLEVLRNNNQPLPGFFLKKRMRVLWKFDMDSTVRAYNVVGIIPGTDPELRNEYVGMGAHYDHVGVIRDTVYNGADDNASGTSAILEAARALAWSRDNERPVLVVFHTAEEKGLLGSKYMAQQEDILKNLVAFINLDMVGGGATDSIYSVGADHISKELQDLTEKINARTVRFHFNYHFNGENDPERIYYRSDHYNYAKKGIPVVFFFDHYMVDYHTPGDDVEKLNLEKITRVAELTYQLASELANRKGRLKLNH